MECNPDAEPAENRSSNESVSTSFGEAAPETKAARPKSSVQTAAPDANAKAPMPNAMVPENEKPRSADGTLSGFLLMWAIHPPGSMPWRTTRSEKHSPAPYYGRESEA